MITDNAAPPIRVTKDVDAIVQVSSKLEYYALSKKLRAKGFSEDIQDGAPICRWWKQGIILDVMPTNPDILGFGNQWYQAATDNAKIHILDKNISIRMVTAAYF